MSASCSIYNSSGSTKVTHTIFLFVGNFQNWVYQNATFFLPHLIGNWEDQALDGRLSFCAKLPKRLIVWETKLYFMTLYTVLRCPLHFRPITSHRMHSGKITWHLLFPTYLHCFSVNNKPSGRTSIANIVFILSLLFTVVYGVDAFLLFLLHQRQQRQNQKTLGANELGTRSP